MRCYLCQSTNYKKRDGEVRDNKNLDILECKNCGLVFLSSNKHIDNNFYEQSNMSQDLNIKEWIKETYIDDSRRFEFIKEMVVNKKVIDFGSGAGGFLIKVKELAKTVVGVELDKKVKKYYKKKNIKLLSNLNKLKNNNFDIITAFHIIEHLQEPKLVLKELISKLKKGGKLIIEVPNSNDALLTIYKNKAFSKFTYWSPHIYLYNSHTLELLFKDIENIEINFIKHIQRYPLSNHLYWLANNKPAGHQQWGNFLDSPQLLEAYETQLATVGATDTIIMQLTKV
jgi:2-polyprenyl-3-methyl-5-hydroxy-6-metoxy-1,4-benzoquinol methylase